jgi:hypothetical protein
MVFQLSYGSIKTYESREAAERAIEIFFPPGFFYEIIIDHHPGYTHFRRIEGKYVEQIRYRVKAYHKDGKFAGYCYDPESEV